MKSRTVNCHNDELLRAKMVAGILALSIISNGIYAKETTELEAHEILRFEAKKPTAHRGLLAQKAIR